LYTGACPDNNPRIYIRTYSKYHKNGWYSMISTLSLVSSSIWAAKNWHPFLKLFFNYMVEISLTATTLGMH
jgi:hypothetical protein